MQLLWKSSIILTASIFIDRIQLMCESVLTDVSCQTGLVLQLKGTVPQKIVPSSSGQNAFIDFCNKSDLQKKWENVCVQ